MAEPRFFDDQSVLRAAEALASHDGPITVVAGAGVSIEAGLPEWWELANRLLGDAAARQRIPKSRREDWVRALMEQGPPSAAAVVQALERTPARFKARVNAALYRKAARLYRPGAIAQQIAWLRRLWGDRLRICTVNYDGLLELALRAEGFAPVAAADGRSRPNNDEQVPVYHLHGRLIPGRGDPPDELVLSEADYGRFLREHGWQDAFMQEALTSSLCVFVGLSFTDPNLLRWLHSLDQPPAYPRLAFFARQSSPRLGKAVRADIERAVRGRWRSVHVEAVYTNFFAEIAQALHEAGMMSRAGPYRSHDRRASERLRRGRAKVVPSRRTAAAQRVAADALQAGVELVREYLRLEALNLGNERFALTLWGLDHENGTLSAWATNDRLRMSTDGLLDNPLELTSRWIAVEAVTVGSAVTRRLDEYVTPWRYIRGVPLEVYDDAGARLGRSIVGALTLASTEPESKLQKLQPNALQLMDGLLAQQLGRFFT